MDTLKLRLTNFAHEFVDELVVARRVGRLLGYSLIVHGRGGRAACRGAARLGIHLHKRIIQCMLSLAHSSVVAANLLFEQFDFGQHAVFNPLAHHLKRQVKLRRSEIAERVLLSPSRG